MKVFTQTDTNISNKRLKEKIEDRLGYVSWVEETRDFEEVEWEEYTNNKKGVLKSWLKRQLERINKFHQQTVDFYFGLIKGQNWQQSGVWGWHLGIGHQGARFCLIKHRTNYEDTVDHELLHAVRVYIWIHTGIDLSNVFGIPFDSGIVHAEHEDYEEYEDYDRVWQKVDYYYQLAHGEDMADEYRGLLKLTVRWAQKFVRQLQVKAANNS